MAKTKRYNREKNLKSDQKEGPKSVADDTQFIEEDLVEWEDDPLMDKVVIGFLIFFFLFVLFTPSEWLLSASMWWNGIK